jgi:acetyl-CoA carboxylase biotin carboxyl carrier protein
VEIGDTLCVIEAMKIFNQIEADQAGVVIEVLKQNGEPVEYGESLFIID